ncbi:CoA transferase [Xanthobacter agilis]|uniref:CoA transferase n=1 Tax=Xanthobacter agilis TaxID=47492 RepID=UPI003726BECD
MVCGLMNGLRVVESSAFIAAPLAGMTLAQHGADVIRIDMIGGGIDYARLPKMARGRSLYWTGLNKGKRSLAVDLRRPEGRELVRELVVAPDPLGGVLLTNIAVPWLSHASLADRRPDVVTCTIEGNPDGSTAVDYTVNCATGFPMMTGNGNVRAPVNHSLPAWDIACAYQAAFGLAAACAERRFSGVGRQLRLALSDVAFSMLSHLGLLAEAELLGSERPALGNWLYGAFGRDFATLDGRRIYVAGISLGQWRALVRACDMADACATIAAERGLDLDVEEDRYAAREAIGVIVESWCSRRTLGAIGEIFDAGGVTWGIYRTVVEALAADARLSEANPLFTRVDTPGIGRHLAARAPLRTIGVNPEPVAPAPLLGQHTDEILLDVLGLPSGAVARLHDDGIVAGPERDPLAAA